MESRPAISKPQILSCIAPMKTFQVSLQLYTVRDETVRDFLGTCEAVAKIGYECIELAGFGSYKPKELRKALDNIGLKISGAHTGEQALSEPQKIIDENKELGNADVTIAWLPENYRDSFAAWRKTSETLERTAELFKKQDMSLGFHNHDSEFQMHDGKRGFDILIESTRLLKLQPDVFWIQKGGCDPVEYITKLNGRMNSAHMKDLGEDGEDIEFGEGLLNRKGILRACMSSYVKTLVLEMDKPRKPPLESARLCFENLLREL